MLVRSLWLTDFRSYASAELALAPGFTALVGHNGAGKTTQIKMMLGLARPTAGRVELLGGDPAQHGLTLRREVGYLPESVSFHLALTGRETLGFYARLCGMTLARGHARSGDAVAIAAYLGKGDRMDRAIVEFAKAYAQQNLADYRAFTDAIAAGRLECAEALPEK